MVNNKQNKTIKTQRNKQKLEPHRDRPICQSWNDFGQILGPKKLQTRLQLFSRGFRSHCDSLGSKIDRKSFEDCGFGRPGGANGANGGQDLEITTPLANNHAIRSAFKSLAFESRLLSSFF